MTRWLFMSKRPNILKFKSDDPKFIGSKKQFWSYFNSSEHDDNDFGSLPYLIQTLLSTDKEKFPMQKAIALYCLFVFSIWTKEEDIAQFTREDKAREAARLLCGLINFFEQRKKAKDILRYVMSEREVGELNSNFFRHNGGFPSLTWTTRADRFFEQIWEAYHATLIMHDVIEFLLKASINLPGALTLKMACEAIAANIFKRRPEYGVLRKDPGRVRVHRNRLGNVGFSMGDREVTDESRRRQGALEERARHDNPQLCFGPQISMDRISSASHITSRTWPYVAETPRCRRRWASTRLFANSFSNTYRRRLGRPFRSGLWSQLNARAKSNFLASHPNSATLSFGLPRLG